jgi:DNA-binding transcriptional LysR family regulator
MFVGFEFRQLVYFVAVAEELNFRKAAERTFVSQPALSYQMQQLEERLGVKLLERDHRSVALTEAGKVLLDGARQLLSQADRLTRDVQEAGSGKEQQLNVGVIDYVHFARLPLALRAVRAEYPDTRVDTVNLPTSEQLEAVLARRIDVGFARLPVEHPDVLTHPVLSGHWTLVLPSQHPLAKKKSIPLASLAGEPLILFSQRINPPLYAWLMDSFRNAGFEPQVAYETNQSRIGPDLVSEGVGLWLALSYLYKELPRGVVARPLQGLDPAGITIGLVWHRHSRSKAGRLLVEQIVAEQSQLLGAKT